MKQKVLTTLLLLLAFVQAQSYRQQSIDINVNGQQRNMVVFTPNTLPDNSPLFIVTHGMNQSPEYQYGSDKMYEMIDTAKFVIAYLRSDGTTWDTGGTKDQNFVLKTIDEMALRFNIDTNRVYWTGFSMGSMLIHHCIPYVQDKIAAFAPTSGIQFSEQPWNNCKKPVNLLEVIAYDDDVFGYEKYGIRAYIENYAKHDQHPNYKKTTGYKPISTSWFNGDLERWTGGPNGGEVVLYSYHNGGHWPMDLNRHLIWNFCKRYTLDPNVPNVKFYSPSTSIHYTYLDTLDIRFRVSDNDGTIKSVLLYVDGAIKKSYRDLDVKDTTLVYQWINTRASTYTIKIVATDNDGKKKEATRGITINNPDPLVMKYACFEDNSFNIPQTTHVFPYKFDMKVNCDNIVAYMTGGGETLRFDIAQEGMSDSITLILPDSINIKEALYTLHITRIKDERGVTASNYKFNYTFGESETSAAALKYMKPFLDSLQYARDLYEQTATEQYESAESLREELKGIIDSYSSFKSTSPTAYLEAKKVMSDACTPLATRKQNLDDYFAILACVDEAIAAYANDPQANTIDSYTRLVRAREYYSQPSKIKNDRQLISSITQLTSYLEKFEAKTVGITDITNSSWVVGTEYYNINGVKTSSPEGLVVKRTHYSNGTIKTEKVRIK